MGAERARQLTAQRGGGGAAGASEESRVGATPLISGERVGATEFPRPSPSKLSQRRTCVPRVYFTQRGELEDRCVNVSELCLQVACVSGVCQVCCDAKRASVAFYKCFSLRVFLSFVLLLRSVQPSVVPRDTIVEL